MTPENEVQLRIGRVRRRLDRLQEVVGDPRRSTVVAEAALRVEVERLSRALDALDLDRQQRLVNVLDEDA